MNPPDPPVKRQIDPMFQAWLERLVLDHRMELSREKSACMLSQPPVESGQEEDAP